MEMAWQITECVSWQRQQEDTKTHTHVLPALHTEQRLRHLHDGRIHIVRRDDGVWAAVVDRMSHHTSSESKVKHMILILEAAVRLDKGLCSPAVGRVGQKLGAALRSTAAEQRRGGALEVAGLGMARAAASHHNWYRASAYFM